MYSLEVFDNPNPIRALIFDFDGTILDTEKAELTAWQRVYADFGSKLPLTQWEKQFNSIPTSFDPVSYLAQTAGLRLEREKIIKTKRQHVAQLTGDLQLLPGVQNWLRTARKLKMRLAVASSSPKYWVEGHLKRIGLVDYFEVIMTREDAKQLKPHPELYQLALKTLGINATQAIAVEDSPIGVAAASAAGLRCVAVPNDITKNLDFPKTLCMLKDLEEATLQAVLKLIPRKR